MNAMDAVKLTAGEIVVALMTFGVVFVAFAGSHILATINYLS